MQIARNYGSKRSIYDGTATSTLSSRKHLNSLSCCGEILGWAVQATKDIACQSLFRPQLEYACSVWDPHTATLIDISERVQWTAARFVRNDKRQISSRVSAMIADWRWSSLEPRRHCASARLINFYNATHVLSSIPTEKLMHRVRSIRMSNNTSLHYIESQGSCDVYKIIFLSSKDDIVLGSKEYLIISLKQYLI